MKKIIILLAVLISVIGVKSQDSKYDPMPLLGDPAPEFTAISTLGNINFPGDYYAKWKILFSHPADFTPVCSSEILELASMEKEFRKLNTAIVVISTDGLNSHIDWINSLETINYCDNGLAKIEFPLISDANLEISRKYGMIHSSVSSTKDIRAIFIINPEDKIAAIFYYPSTVGRNLDEIKRTLIALQTSAKYNVYTPANWKPGEAVLMPSPSTIAEAEKLMTKNDPKLKMLTWYMWFKTL